MSWRGRRVLVTGHTGFKGAWLVLWLRALGAEVTGIALAPEHADGIYAALEPWDLSSVLVDVRNPAALTAAVHVARPEVVFHLAAQPLVRRGYAEPALTYDTNVVGTANLLDAVSAMPTVRAVVVVTSDKVYRQDGADRPFVEGDPLGGHDPYSASKACAELVVAEWAQRAGGVAVATARAGNVIGGGDRAADRLLPDVVRGAETGVPAMIRYPNATRPWQHVLDPLTGYLLLAEHLLGGEAVPPALNFGPDGSASVAEVLTVFLDHLGRGTYTIDDAAQPHEAVSLALDASLARSTIGWRPRLDLTDALGWTAEWYRAQLAGLDVRALSLDQIARYEALS